MAVSLRQIEADESVTLDSQNILVRERIPAGHKVAICNRVSGQPIIKFGWTIGYASTAVQMGQHVHTHNLTSSPTPFKGPFADPSKNPEPLAYSNPRPLFHGSENCDFEDHSKPVSPFAPRNEELQLGELAGATFQGYIRPNGQVGTRNYLAVISNVNCSASVARMIARRFDEDMLREYPNVDGVISFRHESGCGMTWQGSRHRMLSRILAALSRHPNIGGCIFVGLGCEQGSLSHLVESEGLIQIHLPNKPESGRSPHGTTHAPPLPVLSIQDQGGTRRTIERGIEVVRELLPQVDSAKRSTVPVSRIILGTECGGSDGYSGITANPVLGAAADFLVAAGGTVVLSETTEIYGAEHLLARRSRTPAVADQLLERIAWWKEHCARYGELLDNNPSVGNKQGGLTTIAEKSLGAIIKGGSTPLEAVYEYAQDIRSKGLVFMDTPGFDPASVTGMAAGGANLIAFTTGRGSCFGFKPVPSFKIASNSELFNRLRDDMDFDAGPVITGRDASHLGMELFRELIATASGKKTRSELLGIGDEEFVPWLIGPVL